MNASGGQHDDLFCGIHGEKLCSWRGADVNYAVAIDVGGTFSDAFLINLETGQNWCAKSPTTPSKPIVGFMNAITKVLGLADVDPGELRHVVHATTLITNL